MSTGLAAARGNRNMFSGCTVGLGPSCERQNRTTSVGCDVDLGFGSTTEGRVGTCLSAVK